MAKHSIGWGWKGDKSSSHNPKLDEFNLQMPFHFSCEMNFPTTAGYIFELCYFLYPYEKSMNHLVPLLWINHKHWKRIQRSKACIVYTQCDLFFFFSTFYLQFNTASSLPFARLLLQVEIKQSMAKFDGKVCEQFFLWNSFGL